MADMDDHVKQDFRKAKQAYKGGLSKPSAKDTLEAVLWVLTGACAIGVIAVMPWVGPDGLLTGEIWLGLALTFIPLFGGLAYVVRWLPG